MGIAQSSSPETRTQISATSAFAEPAANGNADHKIPHTPLRSGSQHVIIRHKRRNPCPSKHFAAQMCAWLPVIVPAALRSSLDTA